ncbi:response regulator [Vibrio sp. NTOU-M3]|uniref:response regulator n=1 Tax=Vibrio sp. NTOU-M3 TaxID=3234954 RepID=UPI00349F7065
MQFRSYACLILDDHPLVCSAIATLLNNRKRISSVYTATDINEGMKILREHRIDLMVLDVKLTSSDGFEFLRRAKAQGYLGKTLFLSANESRMYSETAFRLGADAYISKSEDMGLIGDAVEGVLNGYSFFKFAGPQKGVSPEVKLSHRETMVLNYLLDGTSNKEIASILNLSAKTISTYKMRILEKYKVKSILELAKATETLVEV